MGVTHDAILIRGARQLLTLRGSKGPRRGAELDEPGVISDGAMLLRGGEIVEVGPSRRVENLAIARDAIDINATGRVVIPGFVDCHTHLIYPPRGEHGADEESAARAMRSWTAGMIEFRVRPFLDAMARHGATTVEIKTGCGPDETAESKALRVIAALQDGAIDVAPTFLLRIPPGASDDEAARIVADLPPRIHRRGVAQFFDLWWDGIASRHTLYARYLESAAEHGIPSKVHAEGTDCAVALALAIGLRAASVDHLEHISDDGVRLLAGARTVATLLPGLVMDGRGPLAPARRLIDAGAAVALASNFNPHRTPTWNMQTIIALACRYMALTPAEAIAAATINAAHALGRGARVGSLEPGKSADVLLLNIDDYRDLGRYFGVNLVHLAIKRGAPIYREAAVRPAN